jgi:ABC-type uncharacterized transport system auxiliary subunit
MLGSSAAPDQTYVLRAAVPEGPPLVPGVLSVLRPAVQPGLDTDRIMLVRGGQELDHFAHTRWGDALSKVVGALAMESLSGGDGFATVVDPARAAVPANYELLLTVRHFEAIYGATGATPPVAHVAFECTVTAGTPRRVLGHCDAEASEPASSNSMGVIVAAMERAAQRAMAQLRDGAVAAARTTGN